MGWSNLIPNPFILGGSGISGEMDVYDSNGNLVLTIDQFGIFVFDPDSVREINIEPSDDNGIPAISFITPDTPASDAGRLVADDAPDAILGTCIVASSTSYTNTVTGASCRSVMQLSPNDSYIAVRRISNGLFNGGFVSIEDGTAELGYATAGTTLVGVQVTTTAVDVTGDMTINTVSQGRGLAPAGGAWATSNSAAIGAETVTHTAANNITFKSGRVYEIQAYGRFSNNGSASTATILQFRKGTTTAGTQLCDFGTIPNASGFAPAPGPMLLANATGSDVVSKICASISTGAGTTVWLGSSTSPSGFTVMDVGKYSQFNGIAPMSFIT